MQKNTTYKKQVLVIIGSASRHSANYRLMRHFSKIAAEDFEVTIFRELKSLPHFDPEISINNPPARIKAILEKVAKADGVIICTPEYVFSIPSGLKNVIEWCVATTVFQNKPTGLITASAHGVEGHKQLQRLMKTLMAKLSPDATLLIQGVRGKMDVVNDSLQENVQEKLKHFISAYKKLIANNKLFKNKKQHYA